MQELYNELKRDQNSLLLANSIQEGICFICLFLFVCLFVCFFDFTCCVINFLILKGIHSSKFLNLNPTGHFIFFSHTNCFCVCVMFLRYVALIKNVLYLFLSLYQLGSLSLLFTVPIILFILFIYECTELADSNIVTTFAVTDKRLVFNVLLFYEVDMKNVLRPIYANSTVLEQLKYSISVSLTQKFSIS